MRIVYLIVGIRLFILLLLLVHRLKMDTSELIYSSHYVYSLFQSGAFEPLSQYLVNCENCEEFCSNEWEWYQLPPHRQNMMIGVHNVLYLKWNDKIWIPFHKNPVPRFRCRFKMVDQTSSTTLTSTLTSTTTLNSTSTSTSTFV